MQALAPTETAAPGRAARASAGLRQALAGLPASRRLSPAQRESLHRLAYGALAAGDHARARRCYEGLVFYGADDARAWRGAAASAHAQSDYRAASLGWTMVTLLEDNPPDASFYAARCQAQLGELAEARDGFEQVSRDERADPALRAQAAQLLDLLRHKAS
jgi:hypothetical protein